MNRVAPRSIAGVAGLSSLLLLLLSPAALAQSAWTGADNNSLWTDPLNWNPNGVPGSTTTALFNDVGNGQTSITLNGTTQSVGGIQFDTANAAAYTLGVGANDAFSITNNNLGTGVGAISVTGTVTNPQAINASVSFAGATPLITDAAATTLTLGAAGGSSTLSIANASPTSLTLTVATGGTLVLNSAITGSVGGTISGSTVTGGLILNQPATGTSTIVFNSGNSTYTGITNINNPSGTQALQIGASTDTASSATFTRGPFGTSTLIPDNGNNSPFQAVNANQTIANPIALVSGFTVTNAATPFNLAFTGPITFPSSQGRTVTINTPNRTVTLGSASAPSTVTLSPTATFNLAFAITQFSTLVLNDVIQDNSASVHNTISFNSTGNNTPQGTVLITAPNTYSGGTTFNTQSSGTFVALQVELAASTVGNPGAVTSGPLGTGTVTFANPNAPAILEPFGADRTLANALALTNGFFAGNPSSALDPTGPHNLTLSGAITDGGKVITNNMVPGVALFLGSAGSPSTITLTGTGTFQSQSTAAGAGVTVINDLISSTGGLSIKQGGTVYLNNPNNSYTGTTVVTGNGTLASGATLSGTGAVGAAGGSGTVTISSLTASTQGGVILPGNGTTPGTITVPNLTLDPFGRYVFQYNGTNNATGGGVNGLISGTGALSLANLNSGAPFDLNLVPTPGSGVSSTPLSYVIATFAGGISASGDVTGDFTFSGTFGSATSPTVTASGNNLVLTFSPVPEPSAAALMGLGATFLMRRGGRRGKRAR